MAISQEESLGAHTSEAFVFLSPRGTLGPFDVCIIAHRSGECKSVKFIAGYDKICYDIDVVITQSDNGKG